MDIRQEYGQEAWNVLYFIFLANRGLFSDDPGSQGEGASNRETSREQTRFWPQVKDGDDILKVSVPIWISCLLHLGSIWWFFSHYYLEHSFLPLFHFLYFIPSIFLVFSFWWHIPPSYVFRQGIGKVFFHPLQAFMSTSSCLIIWLHSFLLK